MATDDLRHVLTRAQQHQAFLRTLLRWPEQALAGYPLTRGEIGALLERDGERLIRLGVEAPLARWWVNAARIEHDAATHSASPHNLH